MLDLAIRKSENVLERILFRLVLSAIAMLGLTWLSIAVTGWLALAIPAPAAAAITGAVLLCLSLLVYFVTAARARKSKGKTETAGRGTTSKSDDVISRAIGIAERMAPNNPLAALLFAVLAGVGSVNLPAALNPFLNKILDDVEKMPEVRTRN